ncbi:beta-ketoacyl-[acyl-carrier-protein] synthase family protein [Actinosynnema sp. NPDC020468]|uniref:beta-ketoacyl-[acyl-carrier-protein] synthase family protein n=1 Tax=Actinosynnema sp. NPDC020468 TaxID=3154488 RepID=UPI0033FC8F58
MVRVAVTGLGPVSSVGTGRAAFSAALRAGRTGAAPITSFDTTGFPRVHGCEVPDFAPERLLRRLDPRGWGRTSLFAACAARLAVDDAGLADTAGGGTAVVMGTTSGESQELEAMTAAVLAGGFPAVPAGVATALPAGRISRAVSEELAAEGESLTLATACSASNYAIGRGYDLIVDGDAEVVVAGGADSVCRWAHAGFHRLGALAEHACTPFDADREGILTGEGGSALVLEPLDRALARGARVYAELLGYGLNCDARHIMAPDPDSIAECVRLAHAHAGIGPSEVDYICAHGTGTRANDAVEAAAITKVFGDVPPPVSSVKSVLGHTMGAASGFGAIASVLAIAEGFLPPTAGWRTPDRELAALDVVPVSRPARVRVAQNNGFAFGGNNAITVFGEVA